MLPDIFSSVTNLFVAFIVVLLLLESLFPPSKQFSAWLLKKLIMLYQLVLSPHITTQCRFHPTCSHYGYGCIDRFGTLRGVLLILWRLIRCHPFSRGGEDPIPSVKHHSH